MPSGQAARSARSFLPAWTRVNDGALHAGSSSESSPPVPFPRRPHQRGTSDRGSRLAAYHVDGSLAASFRRNLVSLRAATRTRLHVGVSRGGVGGLLVRRYSRRIIIAVAAVPTIIIPEGYDQAADTPVVAVLESTGEAPAAEAAATHGTAEVPAAKAPPHAPAEVTATHCAAELSAAPAPAPMTACVATGRNAIGRDGGPSQCHGTTDDRDSMQCGFPHAGYLRCK